MDTREEIVKGLLKNIHEALGETYLSDHVKNFCLFVDALRTETTVENNAKHPVGSMGFRYLEHEKNPPKSIEDYISEIGILFQKPGDYKEELDKIFTAIEANRVAKVSAEMVVNVLRAMNASTKVSR